MCSEVRACGMVVIALVASACGWNGSDETPSVSLVDPPPPIRGGTLTIGNDGRTIIIVDRDRARIDRVERTSHGLTRTASLVLSREQRPERAILVENHTWVLRADGRVSVLDAQLQAQEEIDACASPYGLAWDTAFDRAWISCTTGEVVVVARGPTGLAVETRLFVAPDLGDVAIVGARAFVARVRAAEVAILDAETVSLTVSVPISAVWTARPEGPRIDVAHGALRIVPDRRGVLVLHERMREGPPIDINRYHGGGGRGPCDGAAVHVGATHIGEDGAMRSTVTLRGLRYASDFALDPSGQTIAFATPSLFLDGDERGAQMFDALRAADGCVDPNVAPVSGQVTAVAYLADGVPVWQTREPASIVVGSERLILDEGSARDTGHDLFHFGGGAHVPCIACHLDGGDDGHVWQTTQDSRRRTTSLRLRTPDAAGLEATAPFHWDGTLRDLEALFTVHFPGPSGTTLRPDQIDAFAAWVNTLSARPQLANPIGRRRFEALGCATCHGAEGDRPIYDSVDLGTGGFWQVPSLVELGERAPYGHAGCGDRFETMLTKQCGGRAHEVSDPDDIAALSGFLGVRSL